MEEIEGLKDLLVLYLSKDFRIMSEEIDDLEKLRTSVNSRLDELRKKKGFLDSVPQSRKEEIRLAQGYGGLTVSKAVSEEELLNQKEYDDLRATLTNAQEQKFKMVLKEDHVAGIEGTMLEKLKTFIKNEKAK